MSGSCYVCNIYVPYLNILLILLILDPLCALNAYDFCPLYYSLSSGNTHKALEDVNRAKEIVQTNDTGKFNFCLMVVFFVYTSLLFCQIYFFCVSLHGIYFANKPPQQALGNFLDNSSFSRYSRLFEDWKQNNPRLWSNFVLLKLDCSYIIIKIKSHDVS